MNNYVLVFYGSYRSNRMGIRLAEYIVKRLRHRGDDIELVDAKAINLPMLEPTILVDSTKNAEGLGIAAAIDDNLCEDAFGQGAVVRTAHAIQSHRVLLADFRYRGERPLPVGAFRVHPFNSRVLSIAVKILKNRICSNVWVFFYWTN